MTLQSSSPSSSNAIAAEISPPLVSRPGHWIDNWNPEDPEQWESQGKTIARKNLYWSIFCEFLGFVVWGLWSVVVVFLPQVGFTFSTSEIFWLLSLPALVGATLRIPYTFMVPWMGGRNWTIVSVLLLLIPTIGMAFALSNPETPFGVMLLFAAFAGFGGGNFASSMANITFFYPSAQKGYALGLNAAGGNLGAAIGQLVVPIAVTIGAAATLNLPLAGIVWIPFILIAAFGAWKYMDNLSNAKGDIAGALAALREPHLWIMSFLYIGTFGSFIGFSAVFPRLIVDVFPNFSTFAVGAASVSLAFLGPLVGSLSRPYGGKLSDRLGGARVTVFSFLVMAAVALTVVWTLPLQNFWLFLTLFLCLFAASGIGNGSTYRMIPAIFAVRSKDGGSVSTQRKAAAALGLISAIGAYGGFVIPQVLGAAKVNLGSYDAAFYGFVGAYVLMSGITWFFYLRRQSSMATAQV